MADDAQPAKRMLTCGPYSYSPDDTLGNGSFAEVFWGYRDIDGEKVAIKRIHRNRLKKQSNKKLLDSEIQILTSLEHENVVKLLDYQETSDYICLILEYCEGGDLSGYISQHAPLKEPEIAFLLKQIANAMQYLRSKGIVHRDLKPQNILLLRKNELVVKIADFGFARQLFDEDMAATFCGSPLYMAPEVLDGGEYDAKADLWSVGTIIYQCLTGKAPFRANSIKALKDLLKKSGAKLSMPAGTSKELASLLSSLLKLNADERISFDDFFSHPFITKASSPVTSVIPAPAAADKTLSMSEGSMSSISPLSQSGPSAGGSLAGSMRDKDQGLDRSYVVVDPEFVQVNQFADEVERRAKEMPRMAAVAGGAAKASKADVEQLIRVVDQVVQPATAVMKVAMSRLTAHSGQKPMSTSMSTSVGKSNQAPNPFHYVILHHS